MKEIRSHRDLDVWNISMDLAVEIYRVTERYPAQEKYGMVSQMRRAATSIPFNIAEGASRHTSREFRRFVSIALGSATELETQIDLSDRLKLSHDLNLSRQLLSRIRPMLINLRKSLENR